MLAVGSARKNPKTTYTIDFIGSGKVVAMQQRATAQPPAAVSQQEPPPPAEKPKAPKAYDSKSEIAAKPKPKPKPQPKKPAPAPAPLAAPSILDEQNTEAKTEQPTADSANSETGEFEGGNIQTDFATFPYPWYITQVRNSLWSEWEKRRPAGVTLRALITFAIARDGKIKDLKIEKTSQDDSFDFAARSAVINAGPFPPLPMLYEKDELTVTVEFKQEK